MIMITYIVFISTLCVIVSQSKKVESLECVKDELPYPQLFDYNISSSVYSDRNVLGEGMYSGPPGIGGYIGQQGDRKFYLSVSWLRSHEDYSSWQLHGRISIQGKNDKEDDASASRCYKSPHDCERSNQQVESGRLMKQTQGSRADVEALLRDQMITQYDVIDVVGVYKEGRVHISSSGVQKEQIEEYRHNASLQQELLLWAKIVFPEPDMISCDLQLHGEFLETDSMTGGSYTAWSTVADRQNQNSFKAVRRAWSQAKGASIEDRWQYPIPSTGKRRMELHATVRARGKSLPTILSGLPVPPFLPQPSYVQVSLTTMLQSVFVWQFLYGSSGRRGVTWAKYLHQSIWIPLLPANGSLIGTRWSLLVLLFDVVLATTNVVLGLGMHKEALPQFWLWRGGGTEGVCVVLGLAQLGIALGIGLRSLTSNGSFFLWSPHIVVVLTVACVLSTNFNVLVAASTLLLFQSIVLRDIINNIRCKGVVVRPSNEELLVVSGIIISRSITVYTLASTPYLRIINVISPEVLGLICFAPQALIMILQALTRLVASSSDVAPLVMAQARAKRRLAYSLDEEPPLIINRVSMDLFGIKQCSQTCGSVRVFYVHTQSNDDESFQGSFHEEIPQKLRSEAENAWKNAWLARHGPMSSISVDDKQDRYHDGPEESSSDESAEEFQLRCGNGPSPPPSTKADSMHYTPTLASSSVRTSSACESLSSESEEPCCPICYLPLQQVEDYLQEQQQDVLPKIPSAWKQCCVTRCGHVFHFACLEQWVFTSTSKLRSPDAANEYDQNGWNIDWIREHQSEEEDVETLVTCPVCRSNLPDIGRSADNITVVCSTQTLHDAATNMQNGYSLPITWLPKKRTR